MRFTSPSLDNTIIPLYRISTIDKITKFLIVNLCKLPIDTEKRRAFDSVRGDIKKDRVFNTLSLFEMALTLFALPFV